MIFPSLPARDSLLENKIQSSSYLPDILIQPLIYSIPIEGDLASSIQWRQYSILNKFPRQKFLISMETSSIAYYGSIIDMMETLPLEQCYLSENFDIFAKS